MDKPTVAQLKEWAKANYEKGADTFVECWEDSDYEEVIAEQADPLAFMKQLAGIYEERQADARFYKQDGCDHRWIEGRDDCPRCGAERSMINA